MGAVVTALQIAFVFVLLAVFAWGMKRIGGRRAPAGLVSVPVRAPLTGRASLTVATVAGKAYVLGVTEQQVTVIDIRDAAELELPTTTSAPADDVRAPLSGDGPPSPPDTLGAALVYAAARAKKAWAARRSPAAPTAAGDSNAWSAAWSAAATADAHTVAAIKASVAEAAAAPAAEPAPQTSSSSTQDKSGAPAALAPVPVKRSKSGKSTRAAKAVSA